MIPLLVTLGAMIVVIHAVRHLSGWLGLRWGGLVVGLPISTALTGSLRCAEAAQG